MYWVLKKRKVWSAVHREIREIGFLRLNFIDNYNNNMNSTDIANETTEMVVGFFHLGDRSGRRKRVQNV
jgi:hypothetical protein